ncbi:MAG: hypothetical protein MMC23_010011 [Stictis urceolatum]|nr:hypothetical protein [Stictis urceolata]
MGAYDAVPLTGILASLEKWYYVLAWLKELLLYIQLGFGPAGKLEGRRSGAQLIEFLRQASRTGHPDLERLAQNLAAVADSTWLRNLSTWLLYGHMPASPDFFIRRTACEDSSENRAFEVCLDLAPEYVTQAVATSILFAGRSLGHVRDRTAKPHDPSQNSTIEVSPRRHLEILASIDRPITSSGLTRAVAGIRSMLTNNNLESLLPVKVVSQIFDVLHEFMLLGREGFGAALVRSADQCLNTRSKEPRFSRQKHETLRLRGTMIREAELLTILGQTWAKLENEVQCTRYNSEMDDNLEVARGLIDLSIRGIGSREKMENVIAAKSALRTGRQFDDVLLGVPIIFNVRFQPPVDLVLTEFETASYSALTSYLLGTRRAHMRITDLWRLSSLRRIRHEHLGFTSDQATTLAIKAHAAAKSFRLRQIWVTASSTAFFLSELVSYLQSLVSGSWNKFRDWLLPAHQVCNEIEDTAGTSAAPREQSSLPARDPEIVSLAHKQYLDALTQQSFLADTVYTHLLRGLFSLIDHLTALVQRLEVVSRSSDLPDPAAPMPENQVLLEENNELLEALADVGQNVRECLGKLVSRLRQLNDLEREPLGRCFDKMESIETYFDPFQSQCLDSLLLTLNVGVSHEDPGLW